MVLKVTRPNGVDGAQGIQGLPGLLVLKDTRFDWCGRCSRYPTGLGTDADGRLWCMVWRSMVFQGIDWY